MTRKSELRELKTQLQYEQWKNEELKCAMKMETSMLRADLEEVKNALAKQAELYEQMEVERLALPPYPESNCVCPKCGSAVWNPRLCKRVPPIGDKLWPKGGVTPEKLEWECLCGWTTFTACKDGNGGVTE